MKDLFIGEVRDLIHTYLNVSVFDGESVCAKILTCALAGYAPHSKVAKAAALWWETADDEELEDGLANLRYWIYEWLPWDGWRWACAAYYAYGLHNFLSQHNFVLQGDIKEEYDTLQRVVALGTRIADGTTYHAAMRSWDRQARKLGKFRLKRRPEVRIRYRMSHKLYKR